MNKVDRESAISEINKWIDEIGYEDGHIESEPTLTDEMLIKSVMSGEVVFDESGQLVVKLKHPIESKEGDPLHTELTFKHTVAVFEYNNAVKGVKADDADGRMLATIAVFTNVATSRINRLSTKSYRVLQVIAGYLL